MEAVRRPSLPVEDAFAMGDEALAMTKRVQSDILARYGD
jgi:hypothetical protein